MAEDKSHGESSFPFRLTAYGFRWGPMEIARLASIEGRGVVIGIKTDGGRDIEVYCSPHGRSLRLFDRSKYKELT